MKTIFLLALASGCRISELTALRRDKSHLRMASDLSYVELVPVKGFVFKSERILKAPQSWIIPAFRKKDGSHDKLCPVSTFHKYIQLTKD
jgi:integrase